MYNTFFGNLLYSIFYYADIFIQIDILFNCYYVIIYGDSFAYIVFNIAYYYLIIIIINYFTYN